MDVESLVRPDGGAFRVGLIDPSLCTDIIFGFVNISVDKLILQNVNQQSELAQNELLELKKDRPDLRIILAVGGEEVGDVPFERISTTLSGLSTFAKNVASQLRERGFQGLEVAWVTQFERHRNRITAICKALSEAFIRESEESGQERLLLSLVSLPYGVTPRPTYDPGKLNDYTDRITVLAFNYGILTSPELIHNSPLYPDKLSSSINSQNTSMQWWTLYGFPRKKLILGLPTFGSTVVISTSVTKNTSDSYINRNTGKVGLPGPYTKTSGFLSFYEICDIVQTTGWRQTWRPLWEAPVAFGRRGNKQEWISFENPQSFRKKAQFVKDKEYGGIMVWSLDMDDFNGRFCHDSPYPLLRAAALVLTNNTESHPVTDSSHSVLFATVLSAMWLFLIIDISIVYFLGYKKLRQEQIRISKRFSFQIF
ncbi:chitinase-3-like protein 1 [Elysia marginata]|uniref:Chitinase-3-like protein 1 n=1 Tax=Elysia marginata TaxID=1093978 RepID=A0AAV4FEB2_9GAST|nr:chitinase-3-like protein 1 [Elysia marginata]